MSLPPTSENPWAGITAYTPAGVAPCWVESSSPFPKFLCPAAPGDQDSVSLSWWVRKPYQHRLVVSMTSLFVGLELSSFSPDGSSVETFISEKNLIFIAGFHIPGCIVVPSYWLTWLEPISCHAQDASFTHAVFTEELCARHCSRLWGSDSETSGQSPHSHETSQHESQSKQKAHCLMG